MVSTLEARIQYFADELGAKIVSLEDDILNAHMDMTREIERKIAYKIEVLKEMLELYDDVFMDVIYKEK